MQSDLQFPRQGIWFPMAGHAKLSQANSVAALPPTFVGVPEGPQGALPLDLSWAQQRVPCGSFHSSSKGGDEAAGAWRPSGETALLVPWDSTRPLAGSRLWTLYLPAFCQLTSLEGREVLSRHLVSPGRGPIA